MEDKKEKKPLLSDKAKNILNIVVTSLEVLVVIACVVISVLVWVGVSNEPEKRSVNWFAIRTNSMVGEKSDSFNPGDLIIVKKVDINDIKKEDVISFKSKVKDSTGKYYTEIITHRVIDVVPVDGKLTFKTQGDNASGADTSLVGEGDIVGRYSSKIKGVGGIILWLQGYQKVTLNDGSAAYNQTGSSIQFLVIIIPLILLFLYNGVYVVRYFYKEKMRKVAEGAAAKIAVDADIERFAGMKMGLLAMGKSEEEAEALIAEFKANEAKKKAEAEVAAKALEEAEVQQNVEAEVTEAEKTDETEN